MDKNKKKVLLIIGILLIFIAIFTVILSLFIKDDNDTNNPTNNDNSTFNKEISRLDNKSEFFTVNNIINDYYLTLLSKDNSQIYKLLDPDYITTNNITVSNLLNKINVDFENPYFTSTEIYYNANSNITYYFVNGYLVDQKIIDESFKYTPSVNYLVIVNKNKETYMISPISNNINLVNYANNLDLNEKEVKSNKYYISNVSEKVLLTNYINVFKNLLFLDTNRAYQLLDSETKSHYNDYTDFKKNIVNIYDKLSTNVFSYTKENGNIYYIKDDNQNSIIINENLVMDFTISY